MDLTRRAADIRLASAFDAEAIYSISQVWLAVGRTGHRRDGFLLGAPYELDDLREIASVQGVAVAEVHGTIVGYYLFDNHTINAWTSRYRDIIQELRSAGAIGPSDRVCRRAQAAILPEWHNLKLSGLMLRLLQEVNRERYDAVFSLVARDNPKMDAHAHVGWKIVGGDTDFYYVLLPTRPAP